MAKIDSINSITEIEDLIKARYPLIYIVTAEERRVEAALAELGKRRQRKVLLWSCTQGISSADSSESMSDIKDPLRALEYFAKYEDDAIFVLRDFHPYLQDPTVTRRLRDLNREFKGGKHRRCYVARPMTPPDTFRCAGPGRDFDGRRHRSG